MNFKANVMVFILLLRTTIEFNMFGSEKNNSQSLENANLDDKSTAAPEAQNLDEKLKENSAKLAPPSDGSNMQETKE